MQLLFTNAQVLTVDEQGYLLTRRIPVGIQDDKILFTGPVPPDFQPERTIDCRGDLLMPGFVNAHTHSPLCLLRGRGEGLRLQDWLSQVVWPFEARHTYESCYWGALLNAAENIRSGTTCLNDMYIYSDAVAAAMKHCGLRALVTATMTDELLEQKPGWVDWFTDLAVQYRDDPLLRIGIAPHAVYTCGDGTLRLAAALSRNLDLPVHAHVSETADEVSQCAARQDGKTPLQVLDDFGLVHAHTLLAHGTYLTETDICLTARRGACVVHCPRSNLKLGSGIAAIARMLDAGVCVAIGTDSSASSNNQDVLEELRFAALLQKGVERNPTVLPITRCLSMATLNALPAMGFSNSDGIVPGAAADLIVVDCSSETWLPNIDPLANLLYASHSGNVSLTMVAGRILYENNEFQTIDMEHLRYEIARYAHI